MLKLEMKQYRWTSGPESLQNTSNLYGIKLIVQWISPDWKAFNQIDNVLTN